jgi:transposase
MIVLGADTHKRSHTIAAVAAGTGELLGEQTVTVGRRGFAGLLRWARAHDGERVWALEDCRHVSGSLERFLIERGERVLRIPTHLTAKGRRSARQRGKSDPIDAPNVARAALQEGLASFPAAHLDGPELDLRLLVDHRERLVRHRVELNSTLLWHLHDLWPELRLPGGALFSKKWATRIGRRLARAEQTMRVRIARDELRRLRELTWRSTGSSGRPPSSWRSSRRNCSPSRGSGRLSPPSSSARSPARDASRRPPSSPAPPASHRSPPARETRNATGSTRAATARSTRPCTA